MKDCIKWRIVRCMTWSCVIWHKVVTRQVFCTMHLMILRFIPSFASYCHIVKFMHSTFWLFHARTCIVQLWCIVIISCWDMHCIQVNNFWLFHGGVHFVYHYIISDYFMVCIVYLPNFWIILHWNMLCIQLWYFLINSCWYMNCIQ